MPTKTPREIEDKLEEIKYNFLNYNWTHTKEYMYDFLVTKPMFALLEEARQDMKQKCLQEIDESDVEIPLPNNFCTTLNDIRKSIKSL